MRYTFVNGLKAKRREIWDEEDGCYRSYRCNRFNGSIVACNLRSGKSIVHVLFVRLFMEISHGNMACVPDAKMDYFRC